MYKQIFNIAIYKLTPLIIYVWLQTFNQNLFYAPPPHHTIDPDFPRSHNNIHIFVGFEPRILQSQSYNTE